MNSDASSMSLLLRVFLIASCVLLATHARPLHQSLHDVFRRSRLPSCIQPFGSVCGTDLRGIVGFSNCNDQTISNETSFVHVPGVGQVYTGMKWQCVEYARRWLISHRRVTFGSVEIAQDIWNISAVETVVPSDTAASLLPFTSHANGEQSEVPHVGCLLIYSTELVWSGHVSVVVDVDTTNGVVYIAEQNWSNNVWPDKIYARDIKMKQNGGAVTLHDDCLIGWKCVQQ